MKKTTLILILTGTIVYGFGVYKGWFQLGEPITVKAHYIEVNCGEKTIDMRVTAVSDSSVGYIVGKTISPEGFFMQKEFSDLVKTKSIERKSQNLVKEFTLVGYLVKGESKHCFGSACFKVKKFKSEDDKDFITAE